MIAPGWQGAGLGGFLQKCLVEHAKKRGIRGFQAEILPQNQSMIRLALSCCDNVRTQRDDETLCALPWSFDPCMNPRGLQPTPTCLTGVVAARPLVSHPSLVSEDPRQRRMVSPNFRFRHADISRSDLPAHHGDQPPHRTSPVMAHRSIRSIRARSRAGQDRCSKFSFRFSAASSKGKALIQHLMVGVSDQFVDWLSTGALRRLQRPWLLRFECKLGYVLQSLPSDRILRGLGFQQTFMSHFRDNKS